MPTYEAKKPQPLELRFRALLTEGDVKVLVYHETMRLAT